MMTKNFMLTIVALIALLFVVLVAYSLIRYFVISKRNKAADKANEMIFLARVQAQQKEKEDMMRGSIEVEPEYKLSDFSQKVIDVQETPAPQNEEPIVPKIPTDEEIHPRKLNEFFGS